MASVPKHQGRLFRKYVVFFAVLVSGALLTSGLVQLYFSYQENQTTVVSVQRAKAVAAASNGASSWAKTTEPARIASAAASTRALSRSRLRS